MCAFASPKSAPSPIIAHLERTTPQTTKTREPDYTIDAKTKTPKVVHLTEPLPDDLNAITSTPKDPNDIMAIIRRTRAIQRQKAMKEAAKAKEGIPGTKDSMTVGKKTTQIHTKTSNQKTAFNKE